MEQVQSKGGKIKNRQYRKRSRKAEKNKREDNSKIEGNDTLSRILSTEIHVVSCKTYLRADQESKNIEIIHH